MDGFFHRVYEFVKLVPSGTVVTYGQVARAIGAPRCARQVDFSTDPANLQEPRNFSSPIVAFS